MLTQEPTPDPKCELNVGEQGLGIILKFLLLFFVFTCALVLCSLMPSVPFS